MVISSNETSDNYNLLTSTGTLQAHGGGNGGTIVVKGTADISGSTVTAVSMLPGESKDVIRADSMTAENISIQDAGLLDLSGTITTGTENKISISAKAIENLTGASASQAADYASINRNFNRFSDDGSQRELRAFYGLSKGNALKAIDELNTNDKAGSGGATATQGSTLASRVLSSRLATAFGQAPATLSIGGASLDEGNGMSVEIPVMLPEEKQETSWVKFTKNWGNTSGSSNYTGSAVTLGYDWKQGEYGRDGVFASYSTSSYGHADGSENVQDTRLGYYSGLNKGADTLMWYADMGYIYGRRSRGVNFLGIPNIVKASYNSYIFELGGEWKHALHAPGAKTWQASPYGAVQLSYMKNEGYKESGSIKAYDVAGGHNFYSAVEGGMEFSRFLPKGSLNLRFGIRQALTGTNYQEQDTSRLLERTYSKASRMDRTHFVTSLATETEFQPGWQLSTELGFQKGAHDKDVMASIQFRRLW
ncbi:autotransporter domain-containing protein [Anaerovibrio sp.]|uniref:autotransporter outer membrane beta-barrel domain-containing protein n=1 Tax=Anaerovibrio sp. TaxID=1872532 RepID=UPI003F17AE7E